MRHRSRRDHAARPNTVRHQGRSTTGRVWIALVAALVLLGVTACAGRGAGRSEDATPQNPLVLTLAHSLGDTHVTSKALQDFADRVKNDSGGRITVRIHPNGQLGTETEVLEQLMAGVVDMTRVSAPGLATVEEGYHAFGLPYLFEDAESYRRAMTSPGMREFFASTADKGFVGLTYYTSGARSFYTVDRPIRRPQDLKGLKIRVQDMRSQTDMVSTLGGTPVVMPLGETYTALQTGIVDGAESNETVLTQSKHGEVAKTFSVNEHTRIPDVLVIGTPVLERLSAEDQKLLTDAAAASTEAHTKAWEAETQKAIEEARGMGVTFVEDVDTQAFREATRPLVDRYRQEYPGVARVLESISAAR